MKLLVPLFVLTLSATALADSFETQWASFQKDFEALNNRQMPEPIRKPTKKVSYPVIDAAVTEIPWPDVGGRQQEAVSALAEEDKLGYQVSDQKVREKILNLYERPNVVVQQYVIPF